MFSDVLYFILWEDRKFTFIPILVFWSYFLILYIFIPMKLILPIIYSLEYLFLPYYVSVL